MTLNPLKWRLRTVLYAFLGLLGFYTFLIHKKIYSVVVEVTIPNTNPKHVWEFVSDFNNMKKLNPTIEEFSVIDDIGGYDYWNYSIYYKEHFKQFPSIKNYAYAHYSIKSENENFIINSKHETCFFKNLYCVNSFSKFKFFSVGKDAKCIESVEYECPIISSIFCYKEVMYQREKIMDGLKRHFSMRNVQSEDNK